jgi:hypothetical protein
MYGNPRPGYNARVGILLIGYACTRMHMNAGTREEDPCRP